MSESPSRTYPGPKQDLSSADHVARRRSRIKLLLILAIFAIPLILASIWLKMVRESGGELGDTSRGQLIHPAVPITPFSLVSNQGDFDLDTLRGSWTLLYLPKGECLEACIRNLYHMRQVRLALNHRMDRVQRAVLEQDPEQLSEELLAEHEGLIVVRGNVTEQQVLSGQVEAAEAALPKLDDSIYLIDPFANIMMRFPANLPPKSMLKDLKHLLKVSRIG